MNADDMFGELFVTPTMDASVPGEDSAVMSFDPDPRPVAPVPGLTVRVLTNGWMELHAPGNPERLLCTEAQTAMWTSLSRADWNLGDAAAELAHLWDIDPWALRDSMAAWLRELLAAGYVDH